MRRLRGTTEPPPDSVAAGRAALRRTAWDEARAHFEAAGETPEALIGLGIAARSRFDGDAALDAHERGYRLARAAADDRAAAQLALELTLDCIVFRGPAEAAGWLERAGRLLEGVPAGEEHGLLAYLRAQQALEVEHAPAAARRLAAEGLVAARAHGAVDGEMVLLALSGLARVTEGDVVAGMRELDEATAAALAGEVADARLVQLICCHLINACQRVRDLDRAGEWCARVEGDGHTLRRPRHLRRLPDAVRRGVAVAGRLA